MSTLVTSRYYPTVVKNPAFAAAIEYMVQSGLYSENLISGPAVLTPVADGGILKYENGDSTPNAAVALDVLADSISKGVLVWLRDGGTSDPAKNIFISPTTFIDSVNRQDNVKDVITKMSDEIYNLKQTIIILMESLKTVPGMQIPSELVVTKLNDNPYNSVISDSKLVL